MTRAFPFLFGRAFIEASLAESVYVFDAYFPSFSEGLSLRLSMVAHTAA